MYIKSMEVQFINSAIYSNKLRRVVRVTTVLGILLASNFSVELFADEVVDKESYLLDGNIIKGTTRRFSKAVPAELLDTTVGSNGAYVQNAEFAQEVAAFEVKPGVLGFQLSSYGIQAQGSAGVAVGKDVFLALRLQSRSWIGAPADLGETKGRGKAYMGCWQAYTNHYFLGDIDHDGAKDIGAIREEIACDNFYDATEELDKVVRTHRWTQLKWYLLDDKHGWHQDPALDGKCTDDPLTKMPLVGLTTDPIEFVKQASSGVVPASGILPPCVAGFFQDK